jgi:3-deoxy-manno-octulosonate cytidylyltransferase (CMP-KDO synthetase)
MKVICVIPARYGSTRFEGKPLADLCGKTMIQRTYEQAAKSRTIERIYVATDDERIRENAESFGADVIMTSSRHACGTDRIAEALGHIEGEDGDVVVNVQGDEPLISPDAIDAVVEPLLEDSALNMATLVTKIMDKTEYGDPSVAKVVRDKDGYALYCSRSCIPHSEKGHRADAYKQLGIYAFRRGFLIRFSKMEPTPCEAAEKLEQLRALENGFRMKAIETDFDAPSVNTPEDLKKVAAIIRGLPKQ